MMMIRWIIESMGQIKTKEMSDARLFAQSDDFHSNFALLKNQLLALLDQTQMVSKARGKGSIKSSYE